MTACPRSRSHKLRCSATPLAHDYRQQRRHTGEDPRTEALQDLYNAPTVAYEVRGGRQRRTRLYGNAYQPCRGAWLSKEGQALPTVRGLPSGKTAGARTRCIPGSGTFARLCEYLQDRRCSEGLPTYPYTPSRP